MRLIHTLHTLRGWRHFHGLVSQPFNEATPHYPLLCKLQQVARELEGLQALLQEACRVLQRPQEVEAGGMAGHVLHLVQTAIRGKSDAARGDPMMHHHTEPAPYPTTRSDYTAAQREYHQVFTYLFIGFIFGRI